MAEKSTVLLSQLFEAERNVRRLHDELLDGDQAALVDALAKAIPAALDEDEDEANLRLVRAAELLADVDGARSVDLLIDVLGSDSPEARLAAGEALEERGYARFKELALGVERALDRLAAGGPALVELPYVLAEIPEPGVLKLLGRFLQNPEADVVASAIEALAQAADPDSVKLLKPLEADKRTVSMEDAEGDEATVTLGELAKEAIDLVHAAGGERNGGGRPS
ncbi:hypothetical protein BH09MYX1_BH09MYX1_32870 [soil metagenome]